MKFALCSKHRYPQTPDIGRIPGMHPFMGLGIRFANNPASHTPPSRSHRHMHIRRRPCAHSSCTQPRLVHPMSLNLMFTLLLSYPIHSFVHCTADMVAKLLSFCVLAATLVVVGAGMCKLTSHLIRPVRPFVDGIPTWNT